MQRLRAILPLRVQGELPRLLPGPFGVEREAWHVEARPRDGSVTISVTARRPHEALQDLTSSDDPLDHWFMDQVRALTGADLATAFATILPRRARKH
ncbi:MAG: hypothetical protein M3O34_19895 [Chloroflexota bacterium]|nr:hypothetical protein [Chloroflexota bacterium]